MLTYLRIAVTALSLTACVLLVALWVRSYWWWDSLSAPIPGVCYTLNHSLQGQLSFGFRRSFNANDWGWTSFEASEPDKMNWLRQALGYEPRSGFYISQPAIPAPSQLIIFVPHWFVALLAAGAAAFPWLPWSRRFSLRTLLIATTLVAAALGIVVVAR